MDEAMHPLALLCVGLYSQILPNQNGAADSSRGALDVLVQEHQIDCKRSAFLRSSRHHVEFACSQRVRILFECESRGRSSGRESGNRAASWRIP
jgi:hypothetical protein